MNTNSIPEAFVSLSLAIWLVEHQIAAGDVSVAIDGAMVRVHGKQIFDPVSFLAEKGWKQAESTGKWSGSFVHEALDHRILVHSRPAEGDVVAEMTSGARFIAECKKGYIEPSTSSHEYRLMREALGQILTMEEIRDNDVLAVAIATNTKTSTLALRWRRAPLVKKAGIKILTIGLDGSVVGFV